MRAAWLARHTVPGGCRGIDDRVIIAEQPVREKLLLQEQPDPFHGIEFRSAGRQGFEGYIGWDAQGFCLMPPGLIENQEDMFVRINGFGELVEIDLHGVGRDLGQDQREGVIRARLDGAVDVGEGIALVASPGRPLTSCEPAMTNACLLPNAGFSGRSMFSTRRPHRTANSPILPDYWSLLVHCQMPIPSVQCTARRGVL